jgi:hypothetical protein
MDRMKRHMTLSKSSVRAFWACLLVSVGFAAGCGQTYYPDDLGVTQEKVTAIRTSTTLTPQEMRDALAAYGIDEVTINGLLSTVRLADQFGGDLQSAYDKVVDGKLSQMTPDEIQFYGDATEVTTFADADAQAIVDFFKENGIDTTAELKALLDPDGDLTPNDIDANVDEQNLWDVFIDTDTDVVLAKL